MVVLAYVDQWQFPEHGDVGGLIPDALVDGAIAEERHADTPFALALGSEGTAGGDANSPAHDAIRTQDAKRDIRDMHFAAFPAAVAGDSAHNFCHHRFHPPAFGDDMTMAAVGTGDGVIQAQGCTHTHRRGFLSIRQVGQTGHQAPAINVKNGLLEGPDGEHLAVDFEQRLCSKRQVGGWCS